MASEPTVVAEVRKFRAALLTREASLMRRMVVEWRGIEAEIEASMDALALQIEAMQAAGETVNPGKIFRMERFQRLIAEVREQTARYGDSIASAVTNAQRESSWIAEQEALDVLRVAGEAEGQVGASLVRLRPDVVEGMVGLMADGTPLAKHLEGVYGDAARGMSRYLVRAMGQGLNARKTALAMRNGLGLGLDRALVIARTEQMRVSREAHRLTYEASGQVQAYQRLAAKQTRTCLGCLIADGRIYPIEESFSDHPNGRCSLVPILVGGDVNRWEKGSAWLAKQPEAAQVKIMGPRRHGLWQSGAVPLEKMATFTPDPKWGGSWGPTPVGKLVAQAGAEAAV